METKVLKEKSCVYVVPPFQIFKKEDYPLFESFTEEFSHQLFLSLYLNFFEIFSGDVKFNVRYILPQSDSEHIPAELKEAGYNFFFVNSLDFETVITQLRDKLFNGFSSNIVLFSNTIGITAKNIENAFNLLYNEDNYLVIGKSTSGALNYFGFNSYQPGIEKLNNLTSANYDEILKNICAINANVHIFNGVQLIRNLDDFKVLYKVLSSKESFAFCSQKIHELFTNIFIEYKELL